jgi:hypothetical protein
MSDTVNSRPGPCISIRIPLEGSPHVRFLAMCGEDEQRLFDWLEHRPDLTLLIRSLADYSGGWIDGPPGAGRRAA